MLGVLGECGGREGISTTIVEETGINTGQGETSQGLVSRSRRESVAYSSRLLLLLLLLLLLHEPRLVARPI